VEKRRKNTKRVFLSTGCARGGKRQQNVPFLARRYVENRVENFFII
jgi:hypothetical protein